MEIKSLFSCIDYTSLGLFDNETSISLLIKDALHLEEQGFPVASICTFPYFAEYVKEKLSSSSIKVCAVNSSFPHAQSILNSKVEDALLIANHVDELDIVINLGKFKQELPSVDNEIVEIKKAIGNKTLKVILESGEIEDDNLLRKIAQCAMKSGADFIKTSTGKTKTGATVKAVQIMAEEILRFKKENNKTVGLKISGGIRTLEQSEKYIEIVKEVLSPTFLDNKTFRIGASSLITNLKQYM